MTTWVEDTKKDFAEDTTYQVGFKPPAAATATAGTTTSSRLTGWPGSATSSSACRP